MLFKGLSEQEFWEQCVVAMLRSGVGHLSPNSSPSLSADQAESLRERNKKAHPCYVADVADKLVAERRYRTPDYVRGAEQWPEHWREE